MTGRMVQTVRDSVWRVPLCSSSAVWSTSSRQIPMVLQFRGCRSCSFSTRSSKSLLWRCYRTHGLLDHAENWRGYPQLQLIDKVFVVPVVVQRQIPFSSWFGVEGDGVEFLGTCAQAQGRGGHVHRDMAPIIRCIGWLARRDLFVMHTVRTTTTSHVVAPCVTYPFV